MPWSHSGVLSCAQYLHLVDARRRSGERELGQVLVGAGVTVDRRASLSHVSPIGDHQDEVDDRYEDDEVDDGRDKRTHVVRCPLIVQPRPSLRTSVTGGGLMAFVVATFLSGFDLGSLLASSAAFAMPKGLPQWHCPIAGVVRSEKEWDSLGQI